MARCASSTLKLISRASEYQSEGTGAHHSSVCAFTCYVLLDALVLVKDAAILRRAIIAKCLQCTFVLEHCALRFYTLQTQAENNKSRWRTEEK
jgi:hypothetical protein